MNKLSIPAIKAAAEPGMYGDGGGLWLHVGPSGGKSWVFRYMLDGKAREMGLGPLHTISLAQARQRAADQRRLKLDGLDPLTLRHAARTAAKLEAAKAITFRSCAAEYIAANRAGWRNAKHASQWEATLTAYAYPTVGDLAVGVIDTGNVTKILTPIWTTKTETAGRVRGRIEAVLDFAKTQGWREGENPARWKGHMEFVLPKRSKVRKVEHHAALPWREIARFMVDLEKQEGVGALALRFAILTGARTGEVLGAQWNEIDLSPSRTVRMGHDEGGQSITETVGAVWSISAERTKAGREHRVPLSDAALGVLRAAAKLRIGEAPFVFPGGKADKGLSSMSMLMLLRRMKRDDLTAHGFRSSFRDWAAETGKAADIAEAALAHVLGSKTEAAYQRGDLLSRRRRLMAEWAAHCARVVSEQDNVVSMQAAG